MKQAYLIIDSGTGNTRVALVSDAGDLLSVKTKDTVYVRDPAYRDGWYFEPEALWANICSMISAVISEMPSEIRLCAVTATSARQSIVLMDKDGKPFLGLPNVDNRGLAYVQQISDADAVYRRNGRWLSPCLSALKLVGLREVYPEIYSRIHKIASISDWIGFMFTGRCVYEYSQACETQLLDISSLEWSDELCRMFKISPAILPPTVSAGASLGAIKGDLCGRLRLPTGTPFIVSSADTQTAAVGVGASGDSMVLVSGTTSPVVRIVDGPVFDPLQRCWSNCYIKRGEYLLESNAGVTGLNYQRFKSLFLQDCSYEELEQHITAKSEQRIMASLGTLIFGEKRFLHRAGFSFAAPLAADVDRFDFALAIACDIAFSIVSSCENLLAVLPLSDMKILGCGGGLRSAFICQVVSTLTRCRLILPDGFTQASTFGCVAICAEALGFPPPVRDTHRVYTPENGRQQIFEQYSSWKKYRKEINA